MKKLYSSPLAKIFILLAILGFNSPLNAQTVTTFSYTGNVQTFTVPPCVGTITMDLSGAGGAVAPTYASPGGLGGRIVATIPVTAGQVFSVYVGGQNYNGGGAGSTYGGVGGGATDVRTGGNALSNRILIAGGGGGGGTNCFSNTNPGGNGGGATGVTGYQCNAQTSYVGTGGSQTAGGTSLGSLGSAGALGLGGAGSSTYGGGGGGGYYGGGGGSYGGGGGGSSFAMASATVITNSQGIRTGNGIATFSYSQNGNGVTVSPVTATLCNGATASLVANSVVSYTWNNASNSNSIVVTPTSSTIYTVSGTNSVGCITTATIDIAVNATVPVIAVTNTGSNNICPGSTVNLTANGAYTYTWSGSVSNGVPFTPTATSGYTVTGTNACGTTSAAVSVSINAIPTITVANSSPTICSGNTATLVASGASTYLWVGPTTVTNGLAFFPTTTGNYTVIATAANGCTTSAITSISVTSTPGNFPTSSPAQICYGGTATISATGATNYTWFPNASNASSIVVNPTVTTTYTVIKANGNCLDTKVYTLTVNSLPGLLLLTSTTTVCALNQVTLTGGGANTYTWAPVGLGGSSVVVTPSANTIYTLTGSNGTCANTSTIAISTLANPTISLVPSTSVICNGFCTTLTVGGGITYTLTTNPSNGASLSGTQAVDCPTTTTSYSVAGTNSLGCTTGANQIVVVNPNPTFSTTSNPPLVCVAGISTVSAQNLSGVTYSWSTGASTRTNQVSPLTTSVYSVTATFTATQCKTTNTVSVGVFIPTFAITGPTAVCVGGTITINATGASQYTWAGGGYTSTGFPSFAVSPTVPSVYVCTGASTLNGVVCASTNTVLIGIYQNPTITAVVNRTLICKGETAFLTGGGGATYVWSDNQTGSVVPVAPTANSITYTVTGTDANGCVGTATVLLRTSSCIGINEITNTNKAAVIVYPNPSSGLVNIKGESDAHLILIDALGKVVQTKELNQNNGFESSFENLAEGVYILTSTSANGTYQQKIIVKNK